MNDASTLWNEAVTAAVLGSESHPVALTRPSGALGELLGAWLDDPAQNFLSIAATLSLYCSAGRLPAVLPAATLAPCEPDDRSPCRPAASARLATLLEHHTDLLLEWLEALRPTGQRIPEELLPEVLDWGHRHPEHLTRLLPTLGKRGVWLAGHHPAWAEIALAAWVENASPTEIETTWGTGNRAARRLLLESLRQQATPLARHLLAATWEEGSAEERTELLAVLETGLGPQDEPFLEATLDDRSKEVRRVAAGLLARLPASRLVQRQVERARPLLSWKAGGLLRKAQVEVALPESCDKAMQRDGVEPKPPPRLKMGEKAWWLAQMLKTIPPVTWSRAWGQRPAAILEAVPAEWRDLLHESWITAAAHNADLDWVEALLARYPASAELLEALPAGHREPFVFDRIQNQPPLEGMAVARAYRHPWSARLTRAVVGRLYRYYQNGDASRDISLRLLLEETGPRMDASVFAEAAKTLEGHEEVGWQRTVENLLTLLEFRHLMLEELQP